MVREIEWEEASEICEVCGRDLLSPRYGGYVEWHGNYTFCTPCWEERAKQIIKAVEGKTPMFRARKIAMSPKYEMKKED